MKKPEQQILNFESDNVESKNSSVMCLGMEFPDDEARPIPTGDARHTDWFRFGYAYAEINVLEHELESELSSDVRERIESLRLSVFS